MDVIDTDYLVVGAGAAGMAFADSLISACDADVVMVDRRHRPGGHWNDAYPFVRLHQPSAIYGVNSRTLGTNSIDSVGTDTGLYERATGAEICGYFQKVLDEVLLPSSKVRFFDMCDYVGNWSSEHMFVSRMTGARTEVRVRRKVVDTTYLQATVPATHKPSFVIDPGVRFFPVGELVDLETPPGGYTILGGGKTAMDACFWLLEHGVDPDRIRWVRPRDSWVIDRRLFQPLGLMTQTVERFAGAVQTLATAASIADLLLQAEAQGVLWRFDRNVVPTMFRGAILSEPELNALRRIERVTRLGRVMRICTDRIVCAEGEIPTDLDQVHVDCTASGFRSNPAVPIFDPGRITLQGLVGGFTTFSAALIGYVEATRSIDAEKNRLCVPTSPLNRPRDWIHAYCGFLRVGDLQSGVTGAEDVADWLGHARLNLTGGMSERQKDPGMAEALARVASHSKPAMANAERLLAMA